MTSSVESKPDIAPEGGDPEKPGSRAHKKPGKSDILQASFLNDLRKQRMSVIVYLVSGVKQAGMIESFDQHVLSLRLGSSTQLIYKHTIASIVPAAKAIPASPSVSPRARNAGGRANTTVTPVTPVILRKAPRRALTREG